MMEDPEFFAPLPTPDITQEPALDLPPDTAPQPGPASTDAPDPEPVPTPVQVVSVDELIDRLTQGGDQAAEPGADDASADTAALDGVGDVVGDVVTDVPTEPDPSLEILHQLISKVSDLLIDMGDIADSTKDIQERMEIVEQTLDHPALTTSFQDYTVTEALLLLLLLAAFLSACARMLKGGLSWLRS